MPVASGFFITAVLAGVGVPLMASFWAELLVFIAAVKAFPIGGIAAIMGLIISALFMLRVVQKTFYGDENPKYAHLPDMTGFLAVPRIILVSVIMFFGMFPKIILDVIQSAVIPFVSRF
jgi:NADH-quinone oxidoreductase subunit M